MWLQLNASERQRRTRKTSRRAKRQGETTKKEKEEEEQGSISKQTRSKWRKWRLSDKAERETAAKKREMEIDRQTGAEGCVWDRCGCESYLNNLPWLLVLFTCHTWVLAASEKKIKNAKPIPPLLFPFLALAPMHDNNARGFALPPTPSWSLFLLGGNTAVSRCSVNVFRPSCVEPSRHYHPSCTYEPVRFDPRVLRLGSWV